MDKIRKRLVLPLTTGALRTFRRQGQPGGGIRERENLSVLPRCVAERGQHLTNVTLKNAAMCMTE